MPFNIWLKSLPETSLRHVRGDLGALQLDSHPFLHGDQVSFQIERLSLYLSAQPTLIRQAAIRYSLYVRQLDVIQDQERSIGHTCAHNCPRPPVGCCNGEHHIILSLSDVMFARPTQNALHLAHIISGLQAREHAHALQQGRCVQPNYCSRLTSTGCTLRMFKSPRCIHYLCPQVIELILDTYGQKSSAFLKAMHDMYHQVVHCIDDFTDERVIVLADHLFH